MRCPRLILALLLAAFLAAPGQAFFDPITQAGIDRIDDAHLPGEARFLDQAGLPVRLADYFGGPPILFAAVQYDCPNLCGVTLDGLFAGLAGGGLVGGRDYRLLVISIDSREGPAEAAKALAGLTARWDVGPNAVHFLSGSRPEITAATGALGIRSAWDQDHGQFAHISAVAVLTPQGRLARWLMGVQFDPRTLRLGLVEAGEGKIGLLREQMLLLCYGYDPVHGRYGWVVQRLLEVGGAVTVGGLLLYLWSAYRRERRGTR